MASTDITKQTIWEDGDVTEMARFQVDGANGVQADIGAGGSITRFIFDRSNDNELIAEDSLVYTAVIFDTLQTTALDPAWTKDATGHNFKDRVPGANFATGGDNYRVEYHFVGANGELFKIVYEHDANAVLGS